MTSTELYDYLLNIFTDLEYLFTKNFLEINLEKEKIYLDYYDGGKNDANIEVDLYTYIDDYYFILRITKTKTAQVYYYQKPDLTEKLLGEDSLLRDKERLNKIFVDLIKRY